MSGNEPKRITIRGFQANAEANVVPLRSSLDMSYLCRNGCDQNIGARTARSPPRELLGPFLLPRGRNMGEYGSWCQRLLHPILKPFAPFGFKGRDVELLSRWWTGLLLCSAKYLGEWGGHNCIPTCSNACPSARKVDKLWWSI